MFNLRKILGLGLKEFAKDAEPEEVAKAFEKCEGEDVDFFTGPDGQAVRGTEGYSDKKLKRGRDALEGEGFEEPDAGPMMGLLKEIHATLQQLVQSDKQVHAQVPSDSLDALEQELEEKEDKPAEDAEGGFSTGDIPTLSGEELPDNPIPGTDSRAAVLSAIKTMKPVIASMKDAGERKKATDALTKAFRDMAVPGKQKGGYEALLRAKAADGKAGSRDEEYGRNIKDKHHRKPIGGK